MWVVVRRRVDAGTRVVFEKGDVGTKIRPDRVLLNLRLIR
jgi:hypothetical protein